MRHDEVSITVVPNMVQIHRWNARCLHRFLRTISK